MKEITENGTVYEVSDSYPNPPYTKQIKDKGSVSVEPEPEIDVSTLTEKEFQRLMLEALGYKVKK